MLWGVSALKFSVFQKTAFSKFSIDWTCCLTDRKCNKYFSYNLPSSIGARLVLDRSIEPKFWSIEIRSEGFLKGLLSHVFFTLFNFSKSFLLSLSLRPIHLKPIFVIFFLIFLKFFYLQVPVCPFYPFFFILFTFFMHFRCNFRTDRILGFLMFQLVSFKFNH